MPRPRAPGATTHELMAISGHRTLSEVQRYTDAADQLRLADSGMAKRGQSENNSVANLGARIGRRHTPDHWGRTHSLYKPNSFSALPCAMRSRSASLTGRCCRNVRASAIDPYG